MLLKHQEIYYYFYVYFYCVSKKNYYFYCVIKSVSFSRSSITLRTHCASGIGLVPTSSRYPTIFSNVPRNSRGISSFLDRPRRFSSFLLFPLLIANQRRRRANDCDRPRSRVIKFLRVWIYIRARSANREPRCSGPSYAKPFDARNTIGPPVIILLYPLRAWNKVVKK